MKKVIAILMTILMLFTLFQGALRGNVVKGADYSPEDFVGYWINDNATTGGITKIFIKIVGEDFSVRAFGRCSPTDCDWGISTTKISDANDDILELNWVFSFATVKLTIKLTDKNYAEVVRKTHYTDNSGRKDYESKENFTKSDLGEFDKLLLGFFKDIKMLTFTGAPGVMTVSGQAFPLVISSNYSVPQNQIVIAGSKYGKGLVFGFCHDSFFSDSNFDYFDNKTFTSNILSYASKKKVLISVSHGEYFNKSNANKFVNYTNNLGFEVQFLNNEINENVLQTSGILISGSAWLDFKDSEILAIKDFVNNGGILLLAGLGWSWLVYHPEKTLDELPANKLGKEFGMRWVDGVITELKDFIYNDATVFSIFYPESLFVMKRANKWLPMNNGLPTIDQNIKALVIDPGNTNTLYAGMEFHGVYKSTDGGAHWIAASKGLDSQNVLALAIDPNNPNNLYVGLNGFGQSRIYKSTDGGTSWKLLLNGPQPQVSIIVIDPKNSNVIYAKSYNGVYKSTDGGSTWNALQDLKITGVNCIAISSTGTIYVGVFGGIMKSDDNGLTFKSIKNELSDKIVLSIAIDSNNPNVIYAGTDGQGVFKSEDGGLTFTNVFSIGNISSLAIDPANSDTVYAVYFAGNVFKTMDGGVTWKNFDYNFGLTGVSDLNCLVLDPRNSNTLYLGCKNGIYKIVYSPYLISSFSLPGGSIARSGTISVVSGSSQTFTITPDANLHIKDVLVDGVSVGAVSSYTFNNITDNHTIEAIFEINTYTITASASIGGSISPSGTITVTSGESKTFTVTPYSGYKISNVKVDGISKGSISSYTFTNVTANHTIEATFEKEITQTTIVLQIGNSTFTVNGVQNTLDSPPIIKNSRTLLPIRAIIESLGGTVLWDATERKVTVSLGSITIELWIGKPTAKVYGIDTPIDATNPKVVPEIINSRTMLPLRFVTENLGCDVEWDGTTKTITITYQQ